ncbi:hypothetical protein rpr22_0934 [Rickettsia prowazekii str. Rp22]|uniref:Uncharacterized protein n=1 Tax=Rickettsia prowazekii (strain Rp22) TaxID=449216 RepID=D5AYF5_RICPP|nr:hypothetical protein rpr22_0934 [Rickettsia prowazekii str. Rp22]
MAMTINWLSNDTSNDPQNLTLAASFQT